MWKATPIPPSARKTWQRLSPMDALFVYVESDLAPMHVGVLTVYRGNLPFNRYLRHLDARVRGLPRYRQRIAAAPFHLAHPAWEDDTGFDIRRHVSSVRLNPPGSPLQLRQLAEKLFSRRLALDKPPWEQTFIGGLEGGRTAILTCIHHALADGLSCVELLRAMHDDPESNTPLPCALAESKPAAGLIERLTEAIADDLRLPGEIIGELRADYAHLVSTLPTGGLASALGTTSKTLLDYAAPLHRFPFNTHLLSGEKRAAWCEYPLEAVRDAAHKLGGTVNDAVLTIVGGAVCRYLRVGRGGTDASELHVSVPVNIRPPEGRGTLGNRISAQPVSVPLEGRSSKERFDAVRLQTRALKTAGIAYGLHMIAQAWFAVPAPAQFGLGKLYAAPFGSALLSGATALATRDTICTNVAGPDRPLYALGRRCEAMYPLAPVIGGMGVVFPCVSYNGTLYLSAIADRYAVPDIQRLKGCMDRACADFLKVT